MKYHPISATCTGEAAVAFEEGGGTFVFKPYGEFWTILGNRVYVNVFVT